MIVQQLLAKAQGGAAYVPNTNLHAWGDMGSAGISYHNSIFINHGAPIQGSWTALSVGASNMMAIRSDGKLFIWGSGNYGALGNGTTFGASSTPIQIGSSSWTAVCSGNATNLAIRLGGTLFTWGNNDNGQLGNNSSFAASSPVQIGSSSWVAVSAADSTSFAIRSDGMLFAWGRNAWGVMGLGNDSILSTSSPVQIGSSSWTAVSAGRSHVVARRSDGMLFAWGSNYAGQMGSVGYGSVNNPTPVLHPRMSTHSWTALTAGSSHVAAIRSDGLLFTWGYSANAAKGQGSFLNDWQFSPVQVGSSSWTAISAGYDFTMAIRSDGKLFGWGWNLYGELGYGNATSQASPVQIGSSSWTAISCGWSHSVAIRSGGTLFTWGVAAQGALGDGTIVNKSSPVQIGSSSWTAVSAGVQHTLAIRSDGALFAWGFGTTGQLGDGTIVNKSSPVQIGSSSWVAVSAGSSYSMAIRSGGTLFAWGYNNFGRLGDGTTVNKSSPVQIGSSSWTAVSAGTNSSATSKALRSDGALFAWGYNAYYQMGDGGTTNRSSPVQIAAGTIFNRLGDTRHAIRFNANMSASKVYVSGADRDSATLYGYQGYHPGSNSPIQIGSSSWTAIASQENGTSAIRVGGALFSWGWNNIGQLGDSTTVAKSSPVQIGTGNSFSVIGGGIWCQNNLAVTSAATPVLFMAGKQALKTMGGIVGSFVQQTTFDNIAAQYVPSSITQIGSNVNNAGAIGSNGQLLVWGFNRSAVNYYTGIPDKILTPTKIDTTRVWKQVAIAKNTLSFSSDTFSQQKYAMGITTDGKLWGWGDNTYGQLGDGTTAQKISPVQIGSSSWTAVDCGVYHSAAIRSDGMLFTWGVATLGALGDGTTLNKASPVQIGSSSWVAVQCGYQNTYAIRADGRIFSWGAGTSGALGDGTIVAKSSPVQIGSSSWTAIASSRNHVLAIRLGGTLFAWGVGSSGQLGDGTISSKSSPVQIGSSSWTMVSAGGEQLSGAIRSDGMLFTWGSGTNGGIGDGTVTGKSSPVQIGSSSWTAVSIGTQGGMAKTPTNKLFVWGVNVYGTMGDGTTANKSSPVAVTMAAGQTANTFVYRGFDWPTFMIPLT